MTTQSSAISFVSSLNKAYALKATHCVLVHRATVCTHRNAASVLSPVRMFPEFVLCGAPAPGFPKFAKKLSCEQVKITVSSTPTNIMKYCHFRSCVISAWKVVDARRILLAICYLQYIVFINR